ncbi:MAG: hypothetical protein Kow0098_13590 [Ignavibacteriaceae bacterium]
MRIFLLLLIFLCTDILLAQEIDHQYFEKNREVYFSFPVSSSEELTELTNLISIDYVSGNLVYAYANENEFRIFKKLGYKYELNKHPGLTDYVRMSSDPETINDWDSYPTYEGYVNLMYQFQADYPEICQIVEAGNSVQGRKILFARISDNVTIRESEPQFMYTSTMHGDETTGYVLMLRLIDSLLTSYGSDSRITNIVNETELWINPLANPDGTYHSGNHTVNGATRYNANGFDLNRNFPDPGSGVHPNEQPETSVFRQVAESNSFVLSANFHGGAEVVNYPWDTWSRLHADDEWFRFVCHLYADTAQEYSPPNYMNGFDDGITNGYAWYEVNHGRQDYMTYFRHGREVTIELSDVKLLNPDLLPAHWEYNKRSLLTFIENILFGIRGTVTDIYGSPLFATITIPDHDEDNSEVWTDSINGNYHRMISSGTYTIVFSSPGYITETVTGVQVYEFSTTLLNIQLTPEDVPVELTSFTASANGNRVTLNWQTATETNNSGFEIQRKESGWEKVGFVPGFGTTAKQHNYSFVDENLNSGVYQYRLKQIDYDGSFEYSNTVEAEISLPAEFSLEQNYPNPFNPATKIKYTIPSVTLNQSKVDAYVTLKVYDVIGSEVTTLVNERQPAGTYEVEFNSKMLPSGLSSGVYFYRLTFGTQSETRKMIFLF